VTPSITYCSAVCPVNNTTHDISSDQLNSMLLLESLISVIDIFKSMSELMSFVVLFTGQAAEQYVIDGVTILSYWSNN
jgi:hypothetical protein